MKAPGEEKKVLFISKRDRKWERNQKCMKEGAAVHVEGCLKAEEGEDQETTGLLNMEVSGDPKDHSCGGQAVSRSPWISLVGKHGKETGQARGGGCWFWCSSVVAVSSDRGSGTQDISKMFVE